MKSKKLSLLTIFSAVLILACSFFGFSACDFSAYKEKTEVDEKLLNAPDYSMYSDLKFESFAYSGLNNGKWKLDDQTFDVGEDFRSYERFVEYKEAGFTVYLAGVDTRINTDYNEEQWAEHKKMMDDAHKAGLKVILRDMRLYNLSQIKDVGVIGENAEFASEAELDAYVAECVRFYKDHPAFYGVIIADEPSYDKVLAYGQMYKAIKRVLPDKHVQANLLPPTISSYDTRYPKIEGFEGTQEEEILARYELYLRAFIESTGAHYIQYDDYPMVATQINPLYLRGLQIASGLAKEYGIELHLVSQTFGMNWKGNLQFRPVNEDDARWMNNILLGFGVKEMQYFTYMTRPENKTDGESFIDGASYLTYAGEKTNLYYFMQKIMQNNNKFAQTILNFDYQGSRSYEKLPTNFVSTHVANMDNSYTFKKLSSINIDREVALVTELYDKQNDRFMYMVMNVTDPAQKGSRAYQTTEVTFADEYTHVVIYQDGVGTPQKLNGNKLQVALESGQAVFLLPY